MSTVVMQLQKKAHKTVNIDEDVLTDEEPACKNKTGNVDEDVPMDEEPALLR